MIGLDPLQRAWTHDLSEPRLLDARPFGLRQLRPPFVHRRTALRETDGNRRVEITIGRLAVLQVCLVRLAHEIRDERRVPLR